MHYLTLVTVEVPEFPEDEITNQQVAAEMDKLKSDKNARETNFMYDLVFRRLSGQLTTFARMVENNIDWELEPYGENNEEYQEFYDTTEELKSRYESEFEDCIKLANGKSVSIWDNEVYGKYIIKDGKVFQKHWGPLRHEKRTKKSKKMRALPQYPVKKRYSTFDKFAANRSYYDEEQEAYGYYCNPNAFYDWYEIGGRWPDVFLVKAECKEYSTAGKTPDDSIDDAPEGYIWVCAARKKDIEWEAQYNWVKQKAIENYHRLRDCFSAGELPADSYAQITENGISSFGRILFVKDETLEECLYRQCLDGTFKYTPIAFAFLDNGRWNSKYDINNSSGENETERKWLETLASFIEGIGDNTVIVGVDNHR